MRLISFPFYSWFPFANGVFVGILIFGTHVVREWSFFTRRGMGNFYLCSKKKKTSNPTLLRPAKKFSLRGQPQIFLQEGGMWNFDVSPLPKKKQLQINTILLRPVKKFSFPLCLREGSLFGTHVVREWSFFYGKGGWEIWSAFPPPPQKKNPPTLMTIPRLAKKLNPRLTAQKVKSPHPLPQPTKTEWPLLKNVRKNLWSEV